MTQAIENSFENIYYIPPIPYPITALIGDRGDGKTLTLTAIAMTYHRQGQNVYANYTLKGIPFKKVDFETLASFPDWLHDGVVLIDEAHIGVDAYDFFSNRSRDIVKFTTQLRKRRLSMFYTTQIFTSVARRLRLLTNYTIECFRTETRGVIRLNLFDRSQLKSSLNGYIKTLIMDGRPFFQNYDTNEIIEN